MTSISQPLWRKALIAQAISAVLLTPVVAQAAADDSAQGRNVERIEVVGSRLDRTASATGLDMTLRETPQSVTIIDEEFIEGFALENVADVMMFAPGIQAQRAETDRFFFRARGNDITNFQFDGVPVQYNSFFNDAVADTVMFERIEIVRGATGLLTGAGEPSAAINLIRKRPTANNSGYVSAQVGRWDHRRLEADYSANVTSDGVVKARLAGAYEKGESFVDYAEKQNLQLYGVMTADLTDNTLLSVGFDHSQRNPKGSTWGALPLFYADGSQADDLPRSTTSAAKWSRWERDGTNGFISLDHQFMNGWDLHLEYERRDDEMDGYLLYLSGFPDRDTGLGMGASANHYQAERKQDAVRVMASGPFSLFGREHNLTAGLLYSKEDLTSESRSDGSLVVGDFLAWDGNIAPPDFAAVTPFLSDQETTQKGAYIAGRFNLHDQLTLILGNRFSQYEVSGSSSNYEQDGINTPYAGLVFDIVEGISAYASYTEIFQPQNARNANNELLDPVEGSNRELGIKGDFFDEAVTASVAVFKVKKDNVAEPDPNFTEPLPDGSFPQRGVEGTSNKGYEFEITGQPSDTVNLFFSYTHSESEQADGAAFREFLPEDMIRTSALWQLSEPLTIGANISWQSNIVNRGIGPNGADFKQKAYSLVNLMAAYDFTENLTARLNVRNLFDKTYYSSIDFYNQGFFGEPRNVQLTLSYRF
ncbi:TonB-dependent siderophore receptor [Idiomarina xiamenensis]|uniref:TonB-dependent siderophore receptor n=1 Tax=Idiomarina xiamenensis 10-D-4 TaxID=740709 RepID=K2KCM6_9GAMM|nr:TonB-dependent siderophore receptor [Idiomarina xiamenensis]EKE84432.1 TonB-dependent siderophore receptor [Idiomarina xiamenensis 10-D-4]